MRILNDCDFFYAILQGSGLRVRVEGLRAWGLGFGVGCFRESGGVNIGMRKRG